MHLFPQTQTIMHFFNHFWRIKNSLFYLVYLSTMTELISLLLALVGSDEQLEAVLEQQSLGDVRTEVAASSSECVGTAAFVGFRITPQYIHNLQEKGR